MAKRFEKSIQYTEKYKSILKPCTYCGNKDIRIASDTNGWSVVCMSKACDCTGTYTSVKKAIERWNERKITNENTL